MAVKVASGESSGRGSWANKAFLACTSSCGTSIARGLYLSQDIRIIIAVTK